MKLDETNLFGPKKRLKYHHRYAIAKDENKWIDIKFKKTNELIWNKILYMYIALALAINARYFKYRVREMQIILLKYRLIMLLIGKLSVPEKRDFDFFFVWNVKNGVGVVNFGATLCDGWPQYDKGSPPTI